MLPLQSLVFFAFAMCVLPPQAGGQGEPPNDPATILTTKPPLIAADQLRDVVAARGANAESAQFALGIAQTLSAVEQLGRGLYALGPRRDTLASGLPILRLPVPENPDPQVVKVEDINRLLEDFVASLAMAQETLSNIKGEVHLSLPVTQIALDFDGDGASGEKERVGDVLFELRMVNPRPGAGVAELYTVDFDYSDVQWLAAYTHVLSGLAEFMLAWDGREMFEHAGHLIFQRMDTPYDFLEGEGRFDISFRSIADVAALLHTAKFKIRDLARLEKSRRHLLQAVHLSRRTMELIGGETDQHREWIPGPRQKAALPNVVVTQEIIDSWLAFLTDAEAVLKGEKLIPFWRTDDGRGVNLERAMMELKELDVVLWIQGAAAAPYLERDMPLMTAESFRQMQRVTQGNFWTFAVWFN